jgi:predicted negative regulator of RcsB-dependent stress response|tara:strand:+ start:1477 stop:1650 length:174 start_codon:yes stop_codon:yes gene_type:complete
VNIWTAIFAVLLIIAIFCGWLVWVSRFVWESKELAVRYAAIAGAATLGVMIIGMEKL